MRLSIVDPQKVYRGLPPIVRSDVQTLVIAKIKTVLNLEPDDDNRMFGWCIDSGIIQLDLPLSDILPPSKANVQAAIKVLQNDKLFPVYVHCRSSVDRTGNICAAYRVQVQGWPIQKAIDEWNSFGPHPWLKWWQKFLPGQLA